jgi:hypothetical protein
MPEHGVPDRRPEEVAGSVVAPTDETVRLRARDSLTSRGRADAQGNDEERDEEDQVEDKYDERDLVGKVMAGTSAVCGLGRGGPGRDGPAHDVQPFKLIRQRVREDGSDAGPHAAGEPARCEVHDRSSRLDNPGPREPARA